MIKNVKIKMFLTNTVFRGLSAINQIVPKNQNLVLLYSNMGFRDNVAYIYDYMISEKYNEKYQIIRSQNESYEGVIPTNVKVVSNMRAIKCYLRAGHVFYAFGKLPIYPAKNQKVVQMWHGSPFKGVDKRQLVENANKKKKSYYTNAFSTSKIFNEFWCKEFDCGIERISICGHPRTDVMIKPYSKDDLNLNDLKLIMWMPTFRKSKILGYNDVDSADDILPVVKNEDLYRLNETLKQKKCLLWIKLHPMQDLDRYKKEDFSNIIIQSSDDFNAMGLDLYRLLASSDALITDYSSVFYDFMLMNRPIAFTVDDYEEYKDGRGFAVEDPDYYRTGPKIQTIEDLFSFITQVRNGKDEWQEKREKVNSEVNYYRDFKNCKRALKIGGVEL